MYELISTIGHGCFFAGDEFGTALFDYFRYDVND